MKKALITGIGGQDGTYLAEHLLTLGYRVYGIIRVNPKLREHTLPLVGRVEFIYGDVRDELSVGNAIRKSWPDEIYNLAGQVYVPLSWDYPPETFDVNVGGLLRILKTIEKTKSDTRVYQASSSEMFGNHQGACTEETPMNPTSPYGVSKYASHRLVDLYRQRGLYVVAGILFNHESPRRGDEMVTRKIAKAVASWAAGTDQRTLTLGLLESRRDWGFAGEYVKAMHLMLQQDKAQDYVVGTGESHSVREFLLACGEAVGVDASFIDRHVEIDQRLVRVREIYDMRADNTKIQNVLGWQPQMKYKELAKVMTTSEFMKMMPAIPVKECGCAAR